VALCKLAGWYLLLPQLAWALFAGALMGALWSGRYARPFLHHARRLEWQWVKKLVGYGKYVLGTNLSTMFYKSIDKLTLGYLVGPAAFAAYDAAGKITQLVEAPSYSIAAVVFPQGAHRMETEGAAGIKRLYERSVAAVLALILPFVFFVLIWAEPVVWLFAGEQYADTAVVLRLTALFGLFLPFAVQFGTILDSTGRPATNFGYTVFTAVLNGVLSFVLVWKIGLLGAALATLSGYMISFILMQRLLRRDYGINFWNVFRHVPDFYRLAWKMLGARWRRRTALGQSHQMPALSPSAPLQSALVEPQERLVAVEQPVDRRGES
jgi:lipopolysaccharide exporter